MSAGTTHASWRAHDTDYPTPPAHRPRRWGAAMAIAAATLLAACGSDGASSSTESAPLASNATEFSGTLTIGAIPDQDPEVLQRLYGLVAEHLEAELPGVSVEYVPVTDYQGAVSGFVVGDLDAVWFGGLTGVQARLEVDGAEALVQRDIDANFTSVFIANTSSGIEPFDDVDGLNALANHSLTFGSESSTSGRLMPQSFLGDAGLDIDTSFTGQVGFSGSHDATIELVQSGTYETGALNSQVWDSRVAEGAIDTDSVIEVFRTPTYFDYHWVVQPGLDAEFGAGFTEAFADALTSLDATDATDAAILELFGASAFIRTESGNYAAIEAVARAIGAIR